MEDNFIFENGKMWCKDTYDNPDFLYRENFKVTKDLILDEEFLYVHVLEDSPEGEHFIIIFAKSYQEKCVARAWEKNCKDSTVNLQHYGKDAALTLIMTLHEGDVYTDGESFFQFKSLSNEEYIPVYGDVDLKPAKIKGMINL